MSKPLPDEPYLTVAEYFELEGMSPFKHEFMKGVMYAMHCESESDYFEMETESPFRHEYVDGVMYAMAQTGDEHSSIGVNLIALVHPQLRRCQCAMSATSMKLRLPWRRGGGADYYYPDAMISCDPTDRGDVKQHAWRERPSVIFEIVAPNTRAIDGGRKREMYLGLRGLEAYVRIEDSAPDVTIDRRVDGGWIQERLTGLAELIRLPSIGVEVPLEDLYEA
ncbi:MAG TPA: Uma2 family endonuclease [Chthoniobacteraceae bacterium]|nr:Uma2 family endonuclease [Chthoniobacteraceae bacterium]